MLASLINKLMKSASALQDDSWHGCLNEYLILGVSELSDLALLMYVALEIIYDIMIVFCTNKGYKDLLCLSSLSLSSARKPLRVCQG